MTSINAIRFSDYSGAMVCDEQRGWNDEHMIINSADKIKPVVIPVISQENGLVAAYGNTGTSTIGDELKFNIKKRITTEWQSRQEALGKPPEQFASMERLAEWAFEAQRRLKREHLDQTFHGRYGFTANDLIRGYYEKDGEKYEIKNKSIVEAIHSDMIWKGRTGEMTSVFLNAGIIAGYSPEDGFRIFSLSMIEYGYSPVQEIFLADGSGRDMATVYMTEYNNRKTVPERRGAIDRVEGLFEMINAVNAACRHDIGVEGYLSVILFDGSKPNTERMVTISDERAKLAAEIVRAWETLFIKRSVAMELVEHIFWGNGTWEEVDARLWKATTRPDALLDFLRGYPESRYAE